MKKLSVQRYRSAVRIILDGEDPGRNKRLEP